MSTNMGGVTRRRPVVVLGLVVLAVAILSVACGGSSSPGVATVPMAPSATSTTTSAALPALSQTSTHAFPAGSPTVSVTPSPLAYSQCIRAHGVANFPDPDSTGHIEVAGNGIDTKSSQFQAATVACQYLLPTTNANLAQLRQDKMNGGLAIASCIRAHGFPSFPDPSLPGQGTGDPLAGTAIDQSSPQFQAAAQACASAIGPTILLTITAQAENPGG